MGRHLPTVYNVLLPRQRPAVHLERKGRHVTNGIDPRDAGLETTIHLDATQGKLKLRCK